MPRARIALDAAEKLVAVAVGHDDVEEQEVRTLRHELVLELVAVQARHDVEASGLEDDFHELELRVGVVDHHDLGH